MNLDEINKEFEKLGYSVPIFYNSFNQKIKYKKLIYSPQYDYLGNRIEDRQQYATITFYIKTQSFSKFDDDHDPLMITQEEMKIITDLSYYFEIN